MPTKVRAVGLALGIAAAHWVLAVMAFFAVLASELGGHPPWWAVVLGRVWFPLGFPATLIIGRWTPSLLELSNEATMAITAASSLLWGVTITPLWLWWQSRRRSSKAESSAREGGFR